MDHKWTFPVEVESNYDGDTLRCCFDLGFGMRYWNSIRLASVDTPEIRGGTELTKAAGRLARDRVRELVAAADEIIFHSTVWAGKYGRPVGELYLNGVNLSDILISERLGVPYGGGARNQALHELNAQKLLEAGRLDHLLEKD